MIFSSSSSRTTLSSIALLLNILSSTRADCECGYTVNSTLWTDLVETDFLHLKNINESGWIPQEYSVQPEDARGPFGKKAEISNVATNPLKNKNDWSGDGINGGDAGVQLIVRGGEPPKGGLIPMAEMSTNRTDILYGSFRAGMKLTGVNGTCGAFFWYWNNTQEIDMEFLSKQYNDTSDPVNLVLQSPESLRAGFNAANTGSFDTSQLGFAPDEGFHEYRFDWTPDSVKFYADGKLLNTMTKSIPTSPGHITLSHWSNGDQAWSAGPPESDAIMTVEYLKGYFNSSDTKRQGDWRNRCKDINAPNATCEVPEVTAPPSGNASAHTFFFSQEKNMTVNQTVPGAESGAMAFAGGSSIWLSSVSIAVAVYMMVGAL